MQHELKAERIQRNWTIAACVIGAIVLVIEYFMH